MRIGGKLDKTDFDLPTLISLNIVGRSRPHPFDRRAAWFEK